MHWMFWTKFKRLWSLKTVLGGVAALGVATTGYVVHGGDSPDGGVQGAPGIVRGAPGPVAGAGLPLALIAVGYGVYRLVRRRHKSH